MDDAKCHKKNHGARLGSFRFQKGNLLNGLTRHFTNYGRIIHICWFHRPYVPNYQKVEPHGKKPH